MIQPLGASPAGSGSRENLTPLKARLVLKDKEQDRVELVLYFYIFTLGLPGTHQPQQSDNHFSDHHVDGSVGVSEVKVLTECFCLLKHGGHTPSEGAERRQKRSKVKMGMGMTEKWEHLPPKILNIKTVEKFRQA